MTTLPDALVAAVIRAMHRREALLLQAQAAQDAVTASICDSAADAALGLIRATLDDLASGDAVRMVRRHAALRRAEGEALADPTRH